MFIILNLATTDDYYLQIKKRILMKNIIKEKKVVEVR